MVDETWIRRDSGKTKFTKNYKDRKVWRAMFVYVLKGDTKEEEEEAF